MFLDTEVVEKCWKKNVFVALFKCERCRSTSQLQCTKWRDYCTFGCAFSTQLGNFRFCMFFSPLYEQCKSGRAWNRFSFLWKTKFVRRKVSIFSSRDMWWSYNRKTLSLKPYNKEKRNITYDAASQVTVIFGFNSMRMN